eukprot:113390_1
MAELKQAADLLDSLIRSFSRDMSLFSIVDCHAHLTSDEFKHDLDLVLQDGMNVGIAKIICVAETYEDCMTLLELKSKYPDLIEICCGQHPANVDINKLPKILSFIDEHHEKMIGIGEVGLDWTPHVLRELKDIRNIDDDEKIKEEQKIVLKQQIEKAIQYNLPLNVHSRSAGHHTITYCSENGAENVLFHAFDGRASYAKKACDAHKNYFFSIPPSVHRSPQKRKLIKQVPMDHLLLETDSPALSPVKGERNVPINISHSIKYIASIKNKNENEIRQITTKNAMRLFKKMKISL